MNDLALRQENREFKLGDLLAEFLPEGLRESVTRIVHDPQVTLEVLRPQLLERLPEKYHFLLHPVTELTTNEISLFDLARTGSAGTTVGIELDAGATLRVRKVESASGPLVGFAVGGNLAIGVAAQAISAIVLVGLNARTQHSKLFEFALAPGADPLVLAVLPTLPDALVDPSDFQGICNKINSSSLRRVSRQGHSNNTLGVEVAVNRALSEALTGLGIRIDAELGASLKLRYQDTANFILSVERTTTGYLVELSKQRTASTSSVLKLGVDVQLVGLREQLLDRLTAALPDSEPLRELLGKLDEQVEKLKEDNLRKAVYEAIARGWPEGKLLFEVLLGRKTVDAFAENIRQELGDRIDDIVSARINVVNDQAAAAADSVLSALAEELGLTAGQRAQLDGYLAEAIEKGIAGVQQRFAGVTLAKKLLPDGRVVDLLAPLKGLSSTIDEVLEAAGTVYPVAQQLTGVLRVIYERYETIRKRIIRIVKEDLEEKFALAVVWEKSRTESTSRALRLVVPNDLADHPAVAALYQKLWSGDLRGLAALVRSLPAAVEADGEYVRTVERLEQSSFSLAMFGVGLNSTILFSDRVTVGYDHLGRLNVADAAGRVIREFSGFTPWSKEEQIVTAHWAADALRRQLLSSPITIEVTVRDKIFRRDSDVDEFFQPLADAGLIRAGLAEAVKHELFDLSDIRRLNDVEISLKVALRARAQDRLLERDSSDSLLLAYLSCISRVEPNDLREARRLMEADGIDNLPGYLLGLGRLQEMNSSAVRVTPKERMARSLGRAFLAMQNALEINRNNWLVLKEVVALEAATAEAVEAALLDFNRDFSKQFRGPLIRSYANDRSTLHWRIAVLLAFFHGLNELEDAPNPFLPCTLRVGSGPERVFS